MQGLVSSILPGKVMPSSVPAIHREERDVTNLSGQIPDPDYPFHLHKGQHS